MLIDESPNRSAVSVAAQIKEAFKITFEQAEDVVREAIELLEKV